VIGLDLLDLLHCVHSGDLLGRSIAVRMLVLTAVRGRGLGYTQHNRHGEHEGNDGSLHAV
jgi:hypothetical protein